MGVPKQVEEAAALAEELHEQMMNHEEEPEIEEESGIVEEEEDENDELEELRKYKERYEALKGKYDSEVPRLHHDLQEFKKAVFDKLTPKEEVPANEKLAKFSEEYGDTLIDYIKELMHVELEPIIKNSVSPVQQQVASIEETQENVARQNFVGYLDENLKDVNWRKMWAGEDAKFNEFLQKPDPSGLYTYAQLAELYNEHWDGEKLVNLFNLYTKNSRPEKQNDVQKQQLVAPNRSTQHTTPNTEEKRIWTQSMIREFERADRQGVYDEETSKAMWNDLLAAPGENRIRN